MNKLPLRAIDGPLEGGAIDTPYDEVKIVELGWHDGGPWYDDEGHYAGRASFCEWATYYRMGDHGYHCVEWNGPAIERALRARGLSVPSALGERVEATQWRK